MNQPMPSLPFMGFAHVTLFHPGALVATPDALEQIDAPTMLAAVRRHVRADWGELSEEDKRINEHALIQDDGRLLSAYTSKSGVRFYLVTEADRSVTHVMLPEEY